MSDSPEHVSRSGKLVESTSSPTPEELAAWRELCERATPGPWTSEGLCLSDSSRGTFISDEEFYPWVAWTEADAAFIAAARTALPCLIDALEASEAKVRDLGQALTDIKQDVAENYSRRVTKMSFIGADQDWEDEIKKLRADLDAAESKLAEYAGWSPDQFLRYQDKHKELQERYLQKDTEHFNAETALSGVVIERDEAREELAAERTARESAEKELSEARTANQILTESGVRGHEAVCVLAKERDGLAAVAKVEEIARGSDHAAILAAHNARLMAPLERRVGELFDALTKLVKAAECIRHWHDTGRNNEGMIVSAEKVRELWVETDKARATLASTPREGTEEPKS